LHVSSFSIVFIWFIEVFILIKSSTSVWWSMSVCRAVVVSWRTLMDKWTHASTSSWSHIEIIVVNYVSIEFSPVTFAFAPGHRWLHISIVVVPASILVVSITASHSASTSSSYSAIATPTSSLLRGFIIIDDVPKVICVVPFLLPVLLIIIFGVVFTFFVSVPTLSSFFFLFRCFVTFHCVVWVVNRFVFFTATWLASYIV
jgi:hypothetical protein